MDESYRVAVFSFLTPLLTGLSPPQVYIHCDKGKHRTVRAARGRLAL